MRGARTRDLTYDAVVRGVGSILPVLVTVLTLAVAGDRAAVASPQPVDPPSQEAPMSDAPAPPELRNRLGDETSPYLLQHRHNPVAWFPWGDEAFETARTLDRPIFLSVGYSTCYWCHVMERESLRERRRRGRS